MKRAPDLLALAALALVAGLFWEWNVLGADARVVGFANHDLFTEFLPRHHYFGARLGAGELPLWDPHQIAGLPFLATLQGGALYPPNALYALLPTGTAMGALALLHLVLAGGFAYALCRELARSRPAAWMGGLVFALGGSTLFLVYHTNAINSAPWLPAALLCAARLARAPGWRWTLALGLCLALQFLAGRDYTFLMTVHTVALFAVFQAVWLWRDGRGAGAVLRHLVWLAAGGTLALGLAAAQILPTLELTAASGRSLAGLEGELLEVFGPLPPSFFLANLVNPLRGPLRREYFGWLPLVLWLLAFRPLGRDRAAAFASTLSLLAVALCFGSETPLYGLYRGLPLAGAFRLPDRFVFLLSLGIALGAATGFDLVFGARGSPRERLRGIAPGLAAIAFFGAVLGAALASGWLEAGLAVTARKPWSWFWLYGIDLRHFAHLERSLAYLAGAVALVLLGVWRAGRPSAHALQLAILLLAALDLAHALANPLLHPARSVEPAYGAAACYREAQALTGELGRFLALGPLDSVALKDKDGELFGLYSATHYDPLVTRRQAAYFAALEEGGTWRVETPSHSRSLFMGFLTRIPTPERRRLLDLLGVQALLVDARTTSTPAVQRLLQGLVPAARCSVPAASGPVPVWVYANPSALPRAFVVHDVEPARDPADALDQLLAPDFDPRRKAVVEGELLALSLRGHDDSRAKIVQYANEEVRVRVDAPRPGLLVLTDSWDPDWHATRDGAPIPIHPTDALFRGVQVPAGSSEITFRYAPAAFHRGAAVSLATTVVALALCWRARPARARARGERIESSPARGEAQLTDARVAGDARRTEGESRRR